MGVLFLLGQWDLFCGRLLQFTWPVLLIALGVMAHRSPSSPTRKEVLNEPLYLYSPPHLARHSDLLALGTVAMLHEAHLVRLQHPLSAGADSHRC